MRLLFLSNVHPNPLSPCKGTFNGALVRALGLEHEVHVVCPISWVDRLRGRRVELSTSPVQIQTGVTASFPTFWYPPKLFRSQYDRWMEWSIRGRLEQDLQTFRPDAILSYWAHPDGAAALHIARRLKIPAISMVGGSDVLLLGKQGSRRRVILRTLIESDAVIAVSDDIARQIVADGVPRDRVHVVRRGVDQSVFHPGDKSAARRKLGLPIEGRIMIGVGRLVPVKDWPTVISACGLLKERQPDMRCYLLGDGPERPGLERQVEQLDLREHVIFKGGQPQANLADWYRAADLVVLGSLSEGVPNVLLEAIASGTPFVATNVGGIPEITDPDCHRLVQPGQPRDMAEAIEDRLNVTASTTDVPAKRSELLGAELNESGTDSISPRPRNRGRGVGGEGACAALDCPSPPAPLPGVPGRGEPRVSCESRGQIDLWRLSGSVGASASQSRRAVSPATWSESARQVADIIQACRLASAVPILKFEQPTPDQPRELVGDGAASQNSEGATP